MTKGIRSGDTTPVNIGGAGLICFIKNRRRSTHDIRSKVTGMNIFALKPRGIRHIAVRFKSFSIFFTWSLMP